MMFKLKSIMSATVLLILLACNSTEPANPELVKNIETEAQTFSQTFSQNLQPRVDSLEQVVRALAQKHNANLPAAAAAKNDATSVAAATPNEKPDEMTQMVSDLVTRLERLKNTREEAQKRYQKLLDDYKAGKIKEEEATAQFEAIRNEFSQYDRAITRTLDVSKSLMEKLPDAPPGTTPVENIPSKPGNKPAEAESPTALQKQ